MAREPPCVLVTRQHVMHMKCSVSRRCGDSEATKIQCLGTVCQEPRGANTCTGKRNLECLRIKKVGIILAKRGLMFNYGHQLGQQGDTAGPFSTVRPRAEGL